VLIREKQRRHGRVAGGLWVCERVLGRLALVSWGMEVGEFESTMESREIR